MYLREPIWESSHQDTVCVENATWMILKIQVEKHLPPFLAAGGKQAMGQAVAIRQQLQGKANTIQILS